MPRPRDYVDSPLAAGNPFLRWLAGIWRLGGATPRGKDIVLGEVASGRFAIGTGEDGLVVLGVQKQDARAVTAMQWTGAALVRNHEGRDWIALSCRDARHEESGAPEPIAMRMWIPVPYQIMEALAQTNPSKLEAALIEEDGKEMSAGKRLFALPLTLKGF